MSRSELGKNECFEGVWYVCERMDPICRFMEIKSGETKERKIER